jgi:hypothetical protein
VSKPPSIIALLIFVIVIGLLCWSGFEGECSETFTGVKNPVREDVVF